jgi:tetratricopeptide (TPR) repeat protein
VAKKKPKLPKSDLGKEGTPDEPGFQLPDPRLIERFLKDFSPEEGARHPETALDRAEDLVYQALEAAGQRRVTLAKQALAICPDCADAYLVLAEASSSSAEAVQLYEQGVEAGRRAIGEEPFRQHEGRFWGVLETRPYMRARLGLAQRLWVEGRREEAVAHYQAMLRLNPGDNQGVRYLLADGLLNLGRDDELQELLGRYEEDSSADWVFSRALLAYRREGDTPHARGLLEQAGAANPHVAGYLSGSLPMPESAPEYVSPGEESEAVSYASMARGAWRATPGALAWMRRVLKLPLPAGDEPSHPSWRQIQGALVRLDQAEDEVWQVDFRPYPALMEFDGESVRPWVLLVVNRTAEEPLSIELGTSRPEPVNAWDAMIEAMLRPQHGEPHRPGKVEVRRKTLYKQWRPRLEQIGVECHLYGELEQVDCAMAESVPSPELIRSMSSRQEGPSAGEAADLSTYPQEAGEVWQTDVRRLPTWVENEGNPQRPWGAIVANRSEDLILAQDLSLEKIDAPRLWEMIVRSVARPSVGQPHRPGTVEVRCEEFQRVLGPRLEPHGINCVLQEKLDQLDFIYKELGDHLAGRELPAALLDVPGVKPEQVHGFFEAAAGFYRRAPWRQVRGDLPIRVGSSKYQSGPWYAVVMGQSGMTIGLALYEDLEALREVLAGRFSTEEGTRRTSGLSVLFGEEFEMPIHDLEAAEEHRWPIAGPEAYPHAMRINPGRVIRPPLAWELELLEGCLKAIPEFIAAKQPGLTVQVPLACGTLDIELAWVDPL